MSEPVESPSSAVAIVGMACRIPGAASPGELWRNLRSGTESITVFGEDELAAAGVDPREIQDPRYVRAKGVVEGADRFDAAFFGYSPREAALMDPQQRIFLECAWAAMESAGYEPGRYPGAVGVFAGSILSIYLVKNLWPNRDLVSAAGDFQTAVGNDPTFLSTATAYRLDLRGPSVSVGTACSTSLVAVHLACQSLLAYESDMALAGGVSVHLPLVTGYRYADGGILSPDGHCRPFDASAAGTVSSDGAGIVVLKRLDDALEHGDFVHAVILGSAINNDGNRKVGFTAPGAVGEAAVIAEALAVAGVEPDTVCMVEAHGAGTLLGDPIEVAALVAAFGEAGGPSSCALGSVKSNVGHLDAAAGIAGLLKAILSVQNGEIPPTLHFQRPNPEIDLGPFYVNADLRSMPRGTTPLRAGVSSFGIGGTNVHVVVEEPPRLVPSSPVPRRRFDLLTLSARTATALEAATDRLADHLERDPGVDLADVGYTLRHGRRDFEQRRFVVSDGLDRAASALRARDPQAVVTSAAAAEPEVALLFPGLGDHYPGMGWELYCTEPVFRETVDRSAHLLRDHQAGDVRDLLYPDRDWAYPELEPTEPATGSAGTGASDLDLRAMLAGARTHGADESEADRPVAAQPAIFVTEVALATLLLDWGVVPRAMIGHSIGEFAVAHLSGVLSLVDALRLVSARARLIESDVAPGVMLAVPMGEVSLIPLLPDGVSLGAVNGAELCVASGTEEGVRELEALLAAREVSCQRLRSTRAYHSHMMEGVAASLAQVLRTVTLSPPAVPYVSCITGTWITDEQAVDPEYWARHLCRTVRFRDGLLELLSDPERVLLEVGPGQTLTSHAIRERAGMEGHTNPAIPTMRWSYGRQPEAAMLLRGVGQLWLAGVKLDTERLLHRDAPRRVPLPTYPFEGRRHWISPPEANGSRSAVSPGKRPDVSDWFYVPTWKPSSRRRPAEPSREGESWLVFADPAGVGLDLARRLRQDGARVVTVEPGPGFRRERDACVLDPAQHGDYRALVRELRSMGPLPERVVHLWCLTSEEPDADGPRRLDEARFAASQDLGYYSVIRWLQACLEEGADRSFRLDVVANHLHRVDRSDPIAPEKVTVRAPVMVAPQEHPELVWRSVDTDVPATDPARRSELVAQIVEELRGGGDDGTVAYRGGRRWTLAYEPIRLVAPAESEEPLRHRGVYLLTGGMGGVGLVLARHLARSVQARLVLVGRSAFPPREAWATWLSEHGQSDAVSAKILRLQELEDLGADVLVLQANVASEDDMTRVLATVDEELGELHGVIHGAGAVGIETFREIREATDADSEEQFVAKVHGLLVLERLLEARELDFCLLMSSLSAVLGGLGFSAYSAANLFMDAFAQSREARGGTSWTSVDWDSWRLSDVSSPIDGLGATVSDFVMEPEEGAEACRRLLAEGGFSQVVVSTGDLRDRLRQWIDRAPTSGPVTLHERPSLSTPFTAPRSRLEIDLAELWQQLFGLDAIGIHDNFFELGGHSLLATQLNARLYSKLGVEMTLAALLQAPTIAEMAVAVVEEQSGQVDAADLDRLLAEVVDLSDEEVQRLLAAEDTPGTAPELDERPAESPG